MKWEWIVYIENYNIGAQFCRAIHEKVAVVIYVHNSLKFSNIDFSKHCKVKDIEICAVKLNLSSSFIHLFLPCGYIVT